MNQLRRPFVPILVGYRGLWSRHSSHRYPAWPASSLGRPALEKTNAVLSGRFPGVFAADLLTSQPPRRPRIGLRRAFLSGPADAADSVRRKNPSVVAGFHELPTGRVRTATGLEPRRLIPSGALQYSARRAGGVRQAKQPPTNRGGSLRLWSKGEGSGRPQLGRAQARPRPFSVKG